MIRAAAAALIVSTLAALGLIAVYIAGGQPQVEGALLLFSLGGIGIAMGLWGRDLAAGHVDIEERPTLPSERRMRADFVESLERGEKAIGRRIVLVRLFGIAAAGLGIAALFPIRSLGPTPGNALRRTNWRPGSRAIVDATGQPVRPSDLQLGSIVTVFPDGNQTQEDSATLLIRVDPNELHLKPERLAWVVDGVVAYSKICTHVGCPVGLYRETTHDLLCPCHQSTFDVLRGAQPIFGPATRSLPQLPLALDGDGFIISQSDYTEPVGPGFWDEGH
jgi:ubiquinol-cytochrome c reductase iron-sulfur subunit